MIHTRGRGRGGGLQEDGYKKKRRATQTRGRVLQEEDEENYTMIQDATGEERRRKMRRQKREVGSKSCKGREVMGDIWKEVSKRGRGGMVLRKVIWLGKKWIGREEENGRHEVCVRVK